MTSTIRLTAPAKVNLFLGVHGETDERGYHRVDSVMSSIDLVDQVLISPAASLSVTCIPAASFPQEDNSAYRAAVAMGDAFRRKPSFEIVIDKHIPQRSGMGGASADAAAVILGLCDIWGIDTNDPRVDELARGIGADVPFFLYGPPAYLAGAGDDIVEEFPSLAGVPVVVVMPDGPGVTAKEAYEAFDENPVPAGDPRELFKALRAHDVVLAASLFENNLGPIAERIVLDDAAIREWLSGRDGVLNALVTGSGSCVYAVCESPDVATAIAKEAQTSKGWWSYAGEMVGEGPTIVS